jgi:uncharacterized protein (DUF1919 family)
MKFNSPFVNLYFDYDDYLKMLGNLKYYLSGDLKFYKDDSRDYPVAELHDIKIYFVHYKSEQEASEKWKERLSRFNYDNLYVLFAARPCTKKTLSEFEKLEYKYKVCLTQEDYSKKDHPLCEVIHGIEHKSLGFLAVRKWSISRKRYFEEFDYIKWFNTGKIVSKKNKLFS